MKVKLSYGEKGLTVSLPEESTTVISPTYVPGLPDEKGALLAAIRNPIGSTSPRKAFTSKQRIAISVCDLTRPMPSATVLPVLLNELRHIPKTQITILVATGTHRPNSSTELRKMLGREIVENYTVINHNAYDKKDLIDVGKTPSGIPIFLNRHWVQADARITTGFVEPHFFAGFSGGPKMVAPGLAGTETTMHLHGAKMISNPRSTWGLTEGNPIHDSIRQIAYQTGVDFSIDVTINRDRKITAVYAGELFAVHKAASVSARAIAMAPVKRLFDVVLTTNSGYPLDINLYQAVKGMSAASQVVKEGGTIICAAECKEGIPDHGEYGKILKERNTPQELLYHIMNSEDTRQDQWQVQLQSQILLKSEILLKSDYLSDEAIRAAHLQPARNLNRAILEALEKHGPSSRLCVIPEGPQTIPYLSTK